MGRSGSGAKVQKLIYIKRRNNDREREIEQRRSRRNAKMTLEKLCSVAERTKNDDIILSCYEYK